MREDRKGSTWTKEKFKSAGSLSGSVFLSNKGFEEKILNEPLPVFLGSTPSSRRRAAGTWLAGRVLKPEREVTQVEQVMRDTPLGPSCASVFYGRATTCSFLPTGTRDAAGTADAGVARALPSFGSGAESEAEASSTVSSPLSLPS